MPRSWIRVSVVALAVAIAGCGGEGSDASPDGSGADDGGSDGSTNAPEEGGSGDTANTPDLDPAAMPPAGEARVSVDGETFVFLQSEAIDGVFRCDVSPDAALVEFQSGDHGLALQLTPQESGELFGLITAAPRSTDRIYQSDPFTGGGGFALDGNSLAYEGRFDFHTNADPGNVTDVGDGRVEVTCP